VISRGPQCSAYLCGMAMLAFILFGCGGDSPGPLGKPVISFSISPSTVKSGGSATLTWSSSNATACTALWTSGSLAPMGAFTLTGLISSGPFSITCTGAGGSASASVSLTVIPPPLPIVSLSASSAMVAQAGTDTLNWSSTGADACAASGGWSGTEPLSGSLLIGPITKQTAYTLTCGGIGGTASSSVTVGISSTLPPVGPIATLAPGVIVYASSGASTGAVQLPGLLSGGVLAANDGNSSTVILSCCPQLSVGQIFVLEGAAFKVTNTLVTSEATTIGTGVDYLPVLIVTVAVPALDEVFDKIDITGNYTLDASQMVAQSAAARALAVKSARLSLTSRPNAVTPVPLAFNFVQGPLDLIGDATLALQATPTIHYSATGGFSNSSVVYQTSAQVTESVTATSAADQPASFPISRYSIPIPLTVIDSQSNLVAVMAASIDIWVSATGEPSTSYATNYSSSLQQAISNTVSIAGNGALAASTTNTAAGTNSLTLSDVSASPDANTPALRSYGDSIFAAVEVSSSLQLLYTVNLTTVDAKMGARYSGELTVLPTMSNPAYCGGAGGDLEFQSTASLTTSADQFSYPARPPLINVLSSLEPKPLGSFCSQPAVVSAGPNRAAALLSPVTLAVGVAPPASGAVPSGNVAVMLDGAACTAALDATGKGSCSLIPSVPGSRTFTFQYSGDSNYPGSPVVQQGLAVPLAQAAVALTMLPTLANAASIFTFNYAVSPSPANGQMPLPTGSVTIVSQEDQTVCTVVIAPSGMGTCSSPYQPPESGVPFAYTAFYSGDANYSPATSNAVTSTIVRLQLLSPDPIAVGSTVTLTLQTVAAGVSASPPPNLSWTSSDTTVATVANGVVTGIAPGTATVTVTDPVSLATASALVTVTAVNP
jgi:hypothetical protein